MSSDLLVGRRPAYDSTLTTCVSIVEDCLTRFTLGTEQRADCLAVMDISTSTPVNVVGAAIVDDLIRPTTVLSGRRTEPPELAGRWELPGGKVERGEQMQDALHREIREELGVQIELGARVEGPSAGAWPLGGGYLMTVWLARITGGEARPLQDHDELRVLTKAQLDAVSWLSVDRPIIAAVAALMS